LIVCHFSRLWYIIGKEYHDRKKQREALSMKKGGRHRPGDIGLKARKILQLLSGISND
jgi:hypothetical protein